MYNYSAVPPNVSLHELAYVQSNYKYSAHSRAAVTSPRMNKYKFSVGGWYYATS